MNGMLQTPAGFIPLTAAPSDGAPLTCVWHQNRMLVRADGAVLHDRALLEALGIPDQQVHGLGMLDQQYCQAAWIDTAPADLPDHEWRGLRSLFGTLDDAMLGLASRASQICEWARTHRFCGACGGPMQANAHERSMRCGACGHLAYPRISPAMMVLIRRQHQGAQQVLLAFHTQSPSKRFSPLAGFLEAGESIEEAVHREVFEEVGLRVHNLQYFMSQSWPFPHSLMIAFTADYLSGEIRVDQQEIAEARWFGPDDDWPEPVPTVSISSLLVDAHRPR